MGRCTRCIAGAAMAGRWRIFRRTSSWGSSRITIRWGTGRLEIALWRRSGWTAPFLPMIFQGEEFAASTPFQYFADHEDPEMAKAVKEGRRGEFAAFGWSPADIPDPESVETFERSKLKWNEVHQGRHEEMFEWYRSLIALRRGSDALNNGEPGQTKVTFDAEKKWLVMVRGAVTVVCNLGEERMEFENPAHLPLVMASHKKVRATKSVVVLPPDTLAILSTEKASQVV